MWLKSRADCDWYKEGCRALNFSNTIPDPDPMTRTNYVFNTILTRHDQPQFDESYRRAYYDKQTKFNAWRHNRTQAFQAGMQCVFMGE